MRSAQLTPQTVGPCPEIASFRGSEEISWQRCLRRRRGVIGAPPSADG